MCVQKKKEKKKKKRRRHGKAEIMAGSSIKARQARYHREMKFVPEVRGGA